MNSPQHTTAQDNHLAATTHRKAPRTPPNGKPHHREDRVKKSAFEKLLDTTGAFFRTENRRLAAYAARMHVPPSDIDDVIGEVWLDVAKHGKEFKEFADEDAERRLHCWLGHVVHSKAVDALRRLRKHRCEALEKREEELIDEAAAQRAAVAELREWLTVLLEKVRRDNEENLPLLWAHVCQGRSLHELSCLTGLTV